MEKFQSDEKQIMDAVQNNDAKKLKTILNIVNI